MSDPDVLSLDWSRLPEPVLSPPGVAGIIHGTLDALSPRSRAAVLIDTEGVSLAEVAAGLGEPPDAVVRRLHRVRMALRERLTAHFGPVGWRRVIGRPAEA